MKIVLFPCVVKRPCRTVENANPIVRWFTLSVIISYTVMPYIIIGIFCFIVQAAVEPRMLIRSVVRNEI